MMMKMMWRMMMGTDKAGERKAGVCHPRVKELQKRMEAGRGGID
jgi:hypothetical protein